MNIEQLTDEELLAQLMNCCAEGRKLTVRRLLFLIEVEERRLHLRMACSSMFDFCTRRLGMSEGQAYRRIVGARLVRRYPWLLASIERGEIFLSTLAQIQSYVTNENVRDLIANVAGKTRTQVDRILYERFGVPLPIVSYGSLMPWDRELQDLIDRARELMSHVIPDGDTLKLAKRAFRTLIEQAEKEKCGKAENPRPAPTRPTKTIPRASTRAMYERHGYQCAYVDERTGERCPSRVFLQRDHIRERARGGSHDPENLRPMCGGHNKLLAEQTFGRGYIEQRIHLRQRKKKPTTPEEPPA